MEEARVSAAAVVDFVAFKAAREARKASPVDAAPMADVAGARRTLSDDQIAHRRAMLAHLATGVFRRGLS